MTTTMRRAMRRMFAAGLPAAVAIGSVGLPATASALPVRGPIPVAGSSVAPSGTDTEVTFEARGLVLHGSLRAPAHPRTGAAVLLLPGSGPTDRNGNQPGLTANTIGRIADDLAAQGIPSLRFDKLGSGATGLAGLPPERLAEFGFTAQVDHAAAAARVLAERTGVPTDRLILVGHSEGAFTALALAERGIGHGGLGLLAPLPMRYLDLLTAQLNTQLDQAVRIGQMSVADADAARATLRDTIAGLRESGTLPARPDPLLASIGLVRSNAKFLAEADALDPVRLAAAVPDSTPVLLTCSDKDLNVNCAQVGPIRDELGHTDLHFAHFTNANHLLDELGPLPPGPLDMIVPLPQSLEFSAALHDWSARFPTDHN
ncbi:alpha/beta hydrolase [Rhodococcus sp. NPDC058505]|uniref:alpha/beta hydrolase n=1 Tax=Rhodococcus sp. NPDC058505 TaxID=3346531 RepID=UPI003648F449